MLTQPTSTNVCLWGTAPLPSYADIICEWPSSERITAEELLGEMRLSYGLGLAFRLGGIARDPIL